jgi:mono/diheme cytochrome c family protein
MPILLLILAASPADDGFPAAAKVLSQNCVRCHNADKTRGGLDLSTRATAVAGGATNPEALVPGKPEQSAIVERARAGSMPPPKDGRRLTDAEVQSLTHWIEQGAPWPEGQTLPLPESKPAAKSYVAPPSAPRPRLLWRRRR